MNIIESNENYITARDIITNNGLKKYTMINNNPEKHRPFKRIFGQDITNITFLTENQVNDRKSSFFQAVNIIKANQTKHQHQNTINQKILFNSSILETEKQKIISTLPNEIRPILERGNYYSGGKDIDSAMKSNPQNVSEYKDDILSFYMKSEKTYFIDYDYMRNQHDINEKMREILIDWLIDVHIKFKLLHETLFLTVNIIDRYLSIVDVNRKNLQLVGVAALFIACKYEEIYPPELRHFTYITDNAYDQKQVLQMENNILNKLKFDITIPSSLRYLELFTQYFNFSDQELLLSKYLLELSLVNYKSIIYSPGELAASTICIAGRLLNKKFNHKPLFDFCLYDNNTVANCAKYIYGLLLNKSDNNKMKKVSIKAVYTKYSNKKYLEIALLKYEPIDLHQMFD